MILNKTELYELSLSQIRGITNNEPNTIANLANVVAVLKQNLNYFWIGFYLVEGDELVLGPFQGTPACVRIAKGKGVCGTSWQKSETILVEDVHAFPGHIACDANSESEIVVPIRNGKNEVCMVLDIDHNTKAAFDNIDKLFLEQLADYLQSIL